MANIQGIAGPFSATFNGANIGYTETGFTVEHIVHEQTVNADLAGDVPIDAVEQGVEVAVTLLNIEYASFEAAIKAVMGGTMGQTLTEVGIFRSTLAKQLILTPIGSTTSAAMESTKTWTFPLAIIAREFNILLSSKLRKGPFRFLCYPNASSGTTYTKS